MGHYGTLSAALAYHADRANAAWSATGVTDPQRTAALVRASEALDGQYGDRFPGTKSGGMSQVLEWPRKDAVDACAGEEIPDDAVPVRIEWATYELALDELTTPGSSSPTFVAGDVNKRERVDVIEVERFAVPSGVEAMVPVLAAVERHLRCYLKPDASGGGTFWIERA